jgi:DNA-binding transcriptional MerR regulator
MHSQATPPQSLRLFPEKLFYKIGEASRIVGVEAYVLRYWETEFPSLRPRKSKSGQRVYTRRDLDLILEIKTLLYEQKYTIDGARKKLCVASNEDGSGIAAQDRPGQGVDATQAIGLVKERLREILRILS